jgi:nucleoside-triphosphatase THEP1
MLNRHAVLDPANNHELFRQQNEAIEQLVRNIEEFPTETRDSHSAGGYLVNQVTSLLGERGTGKTTILLRARERMVNMGWCVTDLLVPDVLHNEDAIGPAIFECIYRALCTRATDDEKRKFVSEKMDPLREDLSWFYNRLVPNDIIARDSIGIPDYANNLFSYHISGMLLPAKFSRTVEECVQKLNIQKLVLFIDDADIKIELVEKVLDAVRYIVSSPRIATVFSADLYTLRRRLLNMRLKLLNLEKLPDSEGFSLFGSSGEAFKAREIEAERDYVDAYLMKLLPPATRVPLLPTSAAELLQHKIGVSETAKSAHELLEEISIDDVLTGNPQTIGNLATRYPNVFDTNLRGFVNQHSQISFIIENYRERNASFFHLDEREIDENVAIVGNMLAMSGETTRLVEAVLVRILRVFMDSSANKDWLDAWAYYGFLDIATESRVGRILESVISRMRTAGSALDVLWFKVETTGEQNVELSKRDQVHIVHLIIDLALAFGADIYSLFRLLNVTYHEAFRHFYVSKGLAKYFETRQDEFKIRLLTGSNESGIYGSIVASRNTDESAPVYVSSAANMAQYVHYAVPGEKSARIKKRNEQLGALLRDTKTDRDSKLQAEDNQFYYLLYRMADATVDQIMAAHAIIYDVPATQISTPELTFTSNTEANWGIVTAIKGWSYLDRVFKVSPDRTSEWDRPFLIMLSLAQLPYSTLFACFSTTPGEVAARTRVRSMVSRMEEFLSTAGFVSADGRFVSDDRFRAALRSVDMPLTGRAVTYWPDQDYGERGQSLLELLAFLGREGTDLAEHANLRNDPPPLWRQWKSDFDQLRSATDPKEWGLQMTDDEEDD